MKKFLSVITVMLISTLCFAQNANVPTDSSKKGITYIDIPLKMKINDKIIIQNKSPYTIIQAVVVLTENNQVLGSATYVSSGKDAEMASFDDELLKSIRGKRIAIKVKGIKKVLGDIKSTEISGGGFPVGGVDMEINHTEIKANDLNNVDPNNITYEFNASIHEENHDLYITVSGGSQEDAFDF